MEIDPNYAIFKCLRIQLTKQTEIKRSQHKIICQIIIDRWAPHLSTENTNFSAFIRDLIGENFI